MFRCLPRLGYALPLLLALHLPLSVVAANPPPDAAAIADNNRAVGLMGRFEYAAAERRFARLTERHPDWLDVRVNYAIALLNRQQQGDETLALDMVDTVLARDPGHLRAHYVAGLLRLYLGDPGVAGTHFERVVAADPNDAFAAYYLAQCRAQQGDFEAALAGYRRAVALDPYLRSAWYGAFQAARRLRKRGQARTFLEEYQRLARNPRAHLADFRYTRMGPRGEALALDLPRPPAPSPRPPGPLFGAVQRLSWEGAAAPSGSGPLSITPVVLTDNAAPALFLSGTGSGEGANTLLRFAGGGYIPVSDFPPAAVDGVHAALWGDYDNDGLPDLYLCRKGPNQLWHQMGQGRWQEVSGAAGTSGGDRDTGDCALFDADHDGDLDLFLVNTDGPNELLSNNLDGSFRPLGAERGIGGDARPSLAVVPADLDGDRDADLVILHRTPPQEVWLNDRLWSYRPAPGWDAFRAAPARAALAVDLDADGGEELITLAPDGRLLSWQPGKERQWQAEALARLEAPPGAWGQLAALDADGDGGLEILAVTAGGWSLFDRNGALRFRAGPEQGRSLRGLVPVVEDPARGPALVGVADAPGLLRWPAGSGRYPHLALSLSGATTDADTTRSNRSGIGARVALRRGTHWTLPPVYRRHSGPGQGLQPLALGLGGATQADFVTIEWSDGVFQSELDLEAGRLHRIGETQRQLSSCPVLFAWNGREYAFVTDFLGVGGIGFLIAPGEYAPSRPRENLLLPASLLQPHVGRFLLKLTEPMEEVAYLDAARLRFWDLPPGWQMVLDERMGILGAEPTGEARFYRREVLPQSVIDGEGEEVSGRLHAADGVATRVGELDRRFIGRLKGEQVLTLEFAEPLDRGPGEALLVADGWVEYPYSQTLFAAWQAGARYRAPSLEARGADGEWHLLLEQLGYPAGMPRRMSVALTRLPPGCDALRLSSNMEIYWDRLAVAYAEPLPQVRTSELPLRVARVGVTGFPRWTYAGQRRPLLDYGHRTPYHDTRHMAGRYTRFGPAQELVRSVDDAVAVIGPGEELHLEFDAPEDAPRSGWTRRFVLETNGWAKDMDLFTKDGETVGPVPDTGLPAALRDALHARYNTRYRRGF
jgi:tetratricopeptide (TPR) repeat protein